jgi:hypothetical protein
LPTEWHHRWSAISSAVSAAVAVGALAIAAVGGVFVYWQVEQANKQLEVANRQLTVARENLFSANQYKVETDLFTQVFAMLAALQNERQNPTSTGSHQESVRTIRIFDAYMRAADALHNNHGISDPTWVTLLRTYCKETSNYKYEVGSETLGATKEICERGDSVLLWKGENH